MSTQSIPFGAALASLRALSPGDCCRGVLFHNLLVHSSECATHRFIPAAARAQLGGAK